MDRAELDRRFDHHPPDARRAELHDELRQATKNFTSTVLVHLDNPESREVSLFLTKMEEALFWLNAHVARNVEE
jgi:ribosomal protein L10